MSFWCQRRRDTRDGHNWSCPATKQQSRGVHGRACVFAHLFIPKQQRRPSPVFGLLMRPGGHIMNGSDTRGERSDCYSWNFSVCATLRLAVWGSSHKHVCARVCRNTHAHTQRFSTGPPTERRWKSLQLHWRGAGGRREDWGGWVHVGWEEGGVRSASALTDWLTHNKRPALPQSSNPPFQLSIYVLSLSSSSSSSRRPLTGSLFTHRQSWSFFFACCLQMWLCITLGDGWKREGVDIFFFCSVFNYSSLFSSKVINLKFEGNKYIMAVSGVLIIKCWIDFSQPNPVVCTSRQAELQLQQQQRLANYLRVLTQDQVLLNQLATNF